jgi:hypothetical protein
MSMKSAVTIWYVDISERRKASLILTGKLSTYLLGQKPPPSYDQYHHLLSQRLPVNYIITQYEMQSQYKELL